MPINFGNTIMEGGIEPSVRVQNPVQDDSGAVRASISGTIAQSLAPAAQVAGQIAGTIFQQNQQNESNQILVRYENDLLDLADAVDQGSLDANAAMIRARNIRRQYLGNAPALQTDFDKIWSNTMGANGLGHVVIEGTIQDQAEDAINLEAATLGYTRQEYDVVRARTRELQAISDQFTMIQNRNGIITEGMRSRGLQAVIGVADAAFPAAQAQINTAMAQMNANPEQRAAIAQQTITSIGQQVAAIEGSAMGTDAEFITKPINDLLKTFEDWSNGTVEAAVLENQTKFVQLQYDAMFTRDPVLGPFIAQSNLLKSVGLNDSVLAQNLLNDEVITALRDATDPNRSVNILSDSEGTNRVVQSMTEAAGTELTPEGITEMQEFLGGIVDGAYQNERVNRDGALGYKGTVELLGSPQVTDFVRRNGALPAEFGDEFVNVLRENYEAELIPVIQQTWTSTAEERTVAGMPILPMSELLDVVWNGSAVEFVPKSQYADDPRIVKLANDTNVGDNSIGVPLNNLINAHANVTGMEAKTVWEQQFANQLFNLGEEGEGEVMSELSVTPPQSPVSGLEGPITDPAQLNVNPSELTLEDFNPDPEVAFEQITRTVENTSARIPETVINASNPVVFAEGFLGLTENNREDVSVLSSFIRNTAGININPATTAWCAAFVDAILHSTGSQGTGRLNARSYLDWGQAVTEPQQGDVVVLSRGNPNGWQGHVGFFAGMGSNGKIRILGGNQSNGVNIQEYDASRVLGYRRAN